jgi:tRNA threonylcarbamoyladenosine biosynthesis protein TsaB
MSNILEIDTSDSKRISIGVNIDGKKRQISSNSSILKSEAALPLINKLLKEVGLTIKDVDEISVNLGPGSFTGLRVGVAIANTLGFLLKIPINGQKIGELVQPVYNG